MIDVNFHKRMLNVHLLHFGIDLRKFRESCGGFAKYRQRLRNFKIDKVAFENSDYFEDGEFSRGAIYPLLNDSGSDAGDTFSHYFIQDLFVAARIWNAKPIRHLDVGSRIDGFVAHVASFRDIEVIDVRPLEINFVDTIKFTQQNIMESSGENFGMFDSISCLHALEHFGLGRYGDPVDNEGWRKGILGLFNLLEAGGALYLSVPAGFDQRVEFNAHRVFSLPFLSHELSQQFEIVNLSFITDEGHFIQTVDMKSEDFNTSYNSVYGCGIWELKKN